MARLRSRSQHVRGTGDGDRPADASRGTPGSGEDHRTTPARADLVSGGRRGAGGKGGAGGKASPDLALYCRIKNQAISAWRRREPTEVLRLCAKADRIAPRLDLSRAAIHLRAVEECRRWAAAQLAH